MASGIRANPVSIDADRQRDLDVTRRHPRGWGGARRTRWPVGRAWSSTPSARGACGATRPCSGPRSASVAGSATAPPGGCAPGAPMTCGPWTSLRRDRRSAPHQAAQRRRRVHPGGPRHRRRPPHRRRRRRRCHRAPRRRQGSAGAPPDGQRPRTHRCGTGAASTTPTGPTNHSAGSPPPPTLRTGRRTNTNPNSHNNWTHKRVPLTVTPPPLPEIQ